MTSTAQAQNFGDIRIEGQGNQLVVNQTIHISASAVLSRPFLAELRGHNSSVLSASFSPDGRRIVTASQDQTARLWDAQDGRLLAELRGHRDSVLSASFSPDGQCIITASQGQTARLWDAQDGRLPAELKGHRDSVRSASSAPMAGASSPPARTRRRGSGM